MDNYVRIRKPTIIGEIMDINKIDEQIKPIKLKPSITQKYGVLTVVLGHDLHQRAKKYTELHGYKMGTLMKALLNAYLNEKENNV
jgi:hypothetical protein